MTSALASPAGTVSVTPRARGWVSAHTPQTRQPSTRPSRRIVRSKLACAVSRRCMIGDRNADSASRARSSSTTAIAITASTVPLRQMSLRALAVKHAARSGAGDGSELRFADGAGGFADRIAAGLGDRVHVCDGREATYALRERFVPVDATIVGHVEEFAHDGSPAADATARAAAAARRKRGRKPGNGK